jgi:peptide/nickel transport system permease protein
MAREAKCLVVARGSLIFMFGLVLSANLFSDAVRDGFDPRLRISGR